MAHVGTRFREALGYAALLHEGQPRKRSGGDLPSIPYVAHLLGVASLVLEVDGTEDEAIAALLHDALEDHPRGGRTAQEIEKEFGGAVLAVVRHCTKPDVDESGPEEIVRERRRAQTSRYVEHLARPRPPRSLSPRPTSSTTRGRSSPISVRTATGSGLASGRRGRRRSGTTRSSRGCSAEGTGARSGSSTSSTGP